VISRTSKESKYWPYTCTRQILVCDWVGGIVVNMGSVKELMIQKNSKTYDSDCEGDTSE
jgi:hypothetical protein